MMTMTTRSATAAMKPSPPPPPASLPSNVVGGDEVEEKIKQQLDRYLLSTCATQLKRSVPSFPFDSYYYNARVISVCDADTVWVVFRHDQTLFRYRLRIANIDAPETRGRGRPARYRAFADDATRFVKHLFFRIRGSAKSPVVLHLEPNFDNFGRLVGDVYTGERHGWLSDILVNTEFAVRITNKRRLTLAAWMRHLDRVRPEEEDDGDNNDNDSALLEKTNEEGGADVAMQEDQPNEEEEEEKEEVGVPTFASVGASCVIA